MYGYVRPDKANLRVRDYELFRAAYCGLCEALKVRYGSAARFVVNYDLTFLAMVLCDRTETRMLRCPVHPMNKRPCVVENKALNTAADYSVILAWWKLKDNAKDEAFPRSAVFGTGAAAFKRAFRKAAAAQPEFSENTRKCLAELAAMEKEGNTSLDRAADCFARILAFAAGPDSEDPRQRIRRELFYHVGRYVYILDAVDDLQEDVKKSGYNPLRYRLSDGADKLSEEEKKNIRSTLNLSQRSAAAALELRGEDPWQPILENVVTLGLPAVTDLVFEGRWNEKNAKTPTRGADKI